MSDVIADAMVVKKARVAGEDGGASLQTFCWVMLNLGSLIGRYSVYCPLQQSCCRACQWRRRQRLKDTPWNCLLSNCPSECRRCPLDCRRKGKYRRQLVQSDKAGMLLREIHLFIQTRRLTHSVLFDRRVLLPISWIVIGNAMVPDTHAAMSFWKKSVIHFGANTQAYFDTIGDLFSMVGYFLFLQTRLLIYSTYFRKTSFRQIFFYSQVFLLQL